MNWSLVNWFYLTDFNYWTDYIDPGYTNQESIKVKTLPAPVPRHSSPSNRQTIYHVYLLRSFIPKCTYTNVYIYLFSQIIYSIFNIPFCLSLWSKNMHCMILVLWNWGLLYAHYEVSFGLCSTCTCWIQRYVTFRSHLLIMLVKSLSLLLLIVDIIIHLVLILSALYFWILHYFVRTGLGLLYLLVGSVLLL